jgi:diacylglycerol kinase family enzyme
MAFVGPNLYLAPDLDADDGLLDLVLVTEAERDELEAPLANWQKGDMHVPELTRRRARSIEFDWSGFDVHFDDEAWPPKDRHKDGALKRISLGVERSALQFFAPRGGAEHLA